MEVAVLNIQGTQTGRSVTLAPDVFGLESPNDHAIYLDVKYIQANQRQGTHKAKTRSEVAGSRKKMYRQKGTGNARQGMKSSPLHRHGGRVFGPIPHEYGFKLNKKLRVVARRSALTYKANDAAITVVENFTFDTPKTKSFLTILEKLSVSGKKVLFVLPEPAKAESATPVKKQPNVVYLSGRNIPNLSILPASELNTLAILDAQVIVFTESAVGTINERWAN